MRCLLANLLWCLLANLLLVVVSLLGHMLLAVVGLLGHLLLAVVGLLGHLLLVVVGLLGHLLANLLVVVVPSSSFIIVSSDSIVISVVHGMMVIQLWLVFILLPIRRRSPLRVVYVSEEHVLIDGGWRRMERWWGRPMLLLSRSRRGDANVQQVIQVVVVSS